jgi:hypothetical protein
LPLIVASSARIFLAAGAAAMFVASVAFTRLGPLWDGVSCG